MCVPVYVSSRDRMRSSTACHRARTLMPLPALDTPPMPDAAYAWAALMLSMLENSDGVYLRSNDTTPARLRW